ncbi:sugar-phosphatase [Enterobacteriaceae bacterium ESL0689]|nr:sugar-phosphatase [Enterobacteriaceae bacterium ESL0689]
MAIKLIAIDMDGTLLLPDHTISPAVKEAIAAARARGVNVVLTTGRPYTGVQNYLQELQMTGEGDYCITYNGALVQKAGDGSRVIQIPLNYQDYRYLEQLSRELECHFHALDFNNLYTANRHISPYTVHESFISTIPLVFCEAEKMDPDTQFLKVMMIDEPAILDHAIARIPAAVKEKYTVLKSAPFFLEILDKRASKGASVKLLSDALNIKPQEVMAIGDQENDISMIEFAGMGVAMENATPAVKACADFITYTNQQDGVAYAIDKFVLNQGTA